MDYEPQGYVYSHAVVEIRTLFSLQRNYIFCFSFQTEMENPWQVNSIEAFAYLKCPECDFDSKAESSFKSHAVKTHPLSHVFFENATIDNDTKVTVLKYDPNDIDNYMQENNEELQLASTNSFEIDIVKEEITIDEHHFSEIVVENDVSKFEEQKDETEIQTLCSDITLEKQITHDFQDNESNENPIDISNVVNKGGKDRISKKNESKTPSDKMNLKCNFCSNTKLFSEVSLEKHINLVHGGKKPHCIECNTDFSKDKHLISHMKKVHGHINSHSCPFCGKKMRKEKLKKHVELVHEKKKPNKCNLCNKSFGWKVSLRLHISSIHGAPLAERQPWPCELCKKGFTSQWALKTHIDSVHEGKKPYKCEICNISFALKQSLKKHNEAIHEGIKNYNCNLCSRSYYLKREFVKHFEKYHEGRKPVLIPVSENENSVFAIPDANNDSNTAILNPLQYDSNNIEMNPSNAPILLQYSTTKSAIEKEVADTLESKIDDQTAIHTSDINKELFFDEKTPLPYETEMLEFDFISKSQHKVAHVDKSIDTDLQIPDLSQGSNNAPLDERENETMESETATNEKGTNFEEQTVHEENFIVSDLEPSKESKKTKLICEFCEDKFLSQADLEVHILSIHGGKKPQCSFCNIEFLKERHLSRHLKNVHSAKLTYSCYICNIGITKKSYLKVHIETMHERKKLLKCDLCESSFAYPSALKNHVSNVHGSPRQKKLFPCEICKKKYTSQTALKMHILGVHEGKKPFKCDTCNTCFSYKGDLKSHVQRVHFGIKPYVCNECSSGFWNKQDLMKHFENVHEGKGPININNRKLHKGKTPIEAHQLLKCTECDFSTELSIDLKSHLSSNHAVKKPSFCAICDRSFEEKNNLQKHIESDHGKKVPLDSL